MLTPVASLEQRAEHDEDEQRAGDVEADHQHGEALQRVHAGLADHRGHRAEGTDRRRPHDHRQHPEDQPLQVADAAQDRLAGAAHGLQREADEQRDQQGLQHLTRGQRGEHRGRDDAEQEVGRACRAPSACAAPAPATSSVRCRPDAGVQDVADDQADGQRDRRHGQEVGERQAADLADPGGAAHRADAEHDRAEDDRLDHHLDQGDERRAERLELRRRSPGRRGRPGCRGRQRR